jgi:hypothetical protein
MRYAIWDLKLESDCPFTQLFDSLILPKNGMFDERSDIEH